MEPAAPSNCCLLLLQVRAAGAAASSCASGLPTGPEFAAAEGPATKPGSATESKGVALACTRRGCRMHQARRVGLLAPRQCRPGCGPFRALHHLHAPRTSVPTLWPPPCWFQSQLAAPAPPAGAAPPHPPQIHPHRPASLPKLWQRCPVLAQRCWRRHRGAACCSCRRLMEPPTGAVIGLEETL